MSPGGCAKWWVCVNLRMVPGTLEILRPFVNALDFKIMKNATHDLCQVHLNTERG